MTQNIMKGSRTPNSARLKGARNKVFQAEKARKRAEAEARQAATAKLTPQQRLARLDQAFGVGKGAQRERARLNAMIASDPNRPIKKLQDAVQRVNVGKPIHKKFKPLDQVG